MLRLLAVAVALLAVLVATTGSAFHAPIHDLSNDPADVMVVGANISGVLGHALASGDFNGDGIDDLLAGAPGSNGGTGAAYAIFGSAELRGTVDLASTPPDFSLLGADLSDRLGSSLSAGDFNGDGIDDLLVGAPEADAAANTKLEAGEAYVIFGAAGPGRHHRPSHRSS